MHDGLTFVPDLDTFGFEKQYYTQNIFLVYVVDADIVSWQLLATVPDALKLQMIFGVFSELLDLGKF